MNEIALLAGIRRLAELPSVSAAGKKQLYLFLSDYFPVQRGGDLIKPADICPAIARRVFDNSPWPAEGLLVISGATNTLKSVVARGLIWEYLFRAVGKADGKRPHLVTFEDPIEVLFASKPDKIPREVNWDQITEMGIDYTPREVGKDVKNIKRAFRDALRQSPAVFYVGEVRDTLLWPHVLGFAGTGHFVVATTHANSLTETMSKLLQAAHAQTPSERHFYAQRMVALIHLRRVVARPDRAASESRAIVPSVWRKTSNSLARLVNDGLASILPCNPSSGADRDAAAYGRAYFVNQLAHKRDPAFDNLLVQAADLDLRGE